MRNNLKGAHLVAILISILEHVQTNMVNCNLYMILDKI